MAEFTEIDCRRRYTNRPQLLAAIEECPKRRATLLIARLDRLARNVALIAYAKRNPASEIRSADVLRPTHKTNLVRVDAKELPALLRSIEVYQRRRTARVLPQPALASVI